MGGQFDTKWFGPYAIEKGRLKLRNRKGDKILKNYHGSLLKSYLEPIEIIDLTYLKERESKILSSNDWVNDVIIDSSLQLLYPKSFQSCLLSQTAFSENPKGQAQILPVNGIHWLTASEFDRYLFIL